jgi:uncharacterized integral membrane protein (TIGR00698 family)
MNLAVIGRVGLHGIGYTVGTIFAAVVLGALLRKALQLEKDVALLITMGTAICGGSAIAAIAPVIRAKPQQVSVALGTVFMLNAAALFLFPWIGHLAHLSETQFGLWCALAIHDTSSVVGATLQYGSHAVEVGTTVKLARALWIVPITLVIGFSRSETPGEKAKAKRPWFILGFLAMAALVTWVPVLQSAGLHVEWAAKKLMVLTLFLIGSNLSKKTLQAVGIKPFVQGFCLWICLAAGSLAAIYSNIIY